jgi:pyruvate,water dikinase
VAEIRWLDEVGSLDASVVGGKAASLGELIRAGLPVPAGFAVTTAAYATSMTAAGYGRELAALLSTVDTHDLAALSQAGSAARELVASMPMPEPLESAIRAAYLSLAQKAGEPDLPVAARSSGIGEDSSDASFAGEHDTFLWLSGADVVVDAVRRCWASLFTDRAVSYRAEMGLGHSAMAMGVVVQAMVRPVSAGVAFTLNPVNGDRSVVAIDSSWGFGEAVVAGEVTPDNYIVDKVSSTIVERVISIKEHEYVLRDGTHIEQVSVPFERASSPSLTDDQVVEVARLARRAERHAGCPQDVEWALVRGADGSEAVVLLQARPETVWSRLGGESMASGSTIDPMESIVNTLMSPLNAQRPETR